MPQPNGEVQMPLMQEVLRPVVPEPASGNDSPRPQAGHQARRLTAEEKLEVNVCVVSTRFYSHRFIVFLG